MQTGHRVPLGRSQSSKQLVGSIHSGSLNYHRQMHAFDSSAIPEKARKAAEEVRKLSSENILSLRMPEWNKSTYVDRAKYYSEQLLPARKNYEIRMGLMDENIMKYRPNKIYSGTETRNQYNNWNVSTYIEQQELKKRLEKM
jgi:hypothetical protein